MIWAIVEIFQDYDYVESVECVCTVPTEKDGLKYIENLQSENTQKYLDRQKYIYDYVDNLNADYLELLKQHEEFKCLAEKTLFHSVGKFEDYLKHHLKTHFYDIKLENYDPPKFSFRGSLFVVEIKN